VGVAEARHAHDPGSGALAAPDDSTEFHEGDQLR
jgi:hypothetical protein